MAELVQRYLDQIREEHADVNDGALADYIPELARVDPAGFGLSLSSSDGYVYESGDAAIEFTIQSISKPFTYALALDQIGQDAVDAKIGVEPSGEAFNEISVDDTTKTPKNPMINAGAIAAVSLVPGVTPDERFARIRDFYSACAGRPLDVDPEVYASENGDRQPQPRDRLHAAELRGARRRPRRGSRRLLPAMLDQGHQHRSGPDGGHTGTRRREPDDRAASDRQHRWCSERSA